MASTIERTIFANFPWHDSQFSLNRRSLVNLINIINSKSRALQSIVPIKTRQCVPFGTEKCHLA